jgi:enoyl-CoA hydratase
MNEYVRKERVGNASVWTVDRPNARNAIDAQVIGELERASEEVERDRSVRAVVLCGGGEIAFLAGADLKLLHAGPAELRAEVDRRILAFVERLEALPVPVFAAINGVVMGGGCEVALGCDVRIAEEHASITFKHATLSVTPGWGGLARVTRVLSPGTAAKLFFSAQPLSAQQAREAGFFDEVVPKGGARGRALELASALEQTSPDAIADLKRMLKLAYAGGLSLEEEQRVFLARTTSSDHREALDALFTKRAPRFAPRSR